MTINFIPVRSNNILFKQTGPCWDKGNNFLNIKRIEILSPDAGSSNEYFRSLVQKSENHDPHKCPVNIEVHCFGFNYFHLIDEPSNTFTFNYPNSWFQVELTRGLAVLKGIRIKKRFSSTLNSFKIICTDNANKNENSWINLLEVDEKPRDEKQLLFVYEFPHPSPPIRFVSVIFDCIFISICNCLFIKTSSFFLVFLNTFTIA